jgi:hypothetical protein
MFDPWCAPRLFPSAGKATSADRPLPAEFLDLTDAIARAREDGFRQRVATALLEYRHKSNYPLHCAWVLRGDHQLADDDDDLYCCDAVTRESFLQAEIEPTAASFGKDSGADEHWCREGRQTSNIFHQTIVWQFVSLDVPVRGEPKPFKVNIPIRPFGDQERAKLMKMDEKGNATIASGVKMQAGPFRSLTAEEQRIFKKEFKSQIVEIDVPPYLVLYSGADRLKDPTRKALQEALVREYGEE